MGVETHKAEVVPIKLEKHPDADSLSIVKVYNFTVVARTSDWQGVEKAVYVQPDSVLPDKPEYAFLKSTQSIVKAREIARLELEGGKITQEQYDTNLAEIADREAKNTKYLRITAKKLRGIWSMGMLLPCPDGAQIGDDVAEQLGITHYEPPIIDEAAKGAPGFDVAITPPVLMAPKYDMESIYKYADCFEPGEMVYVTEKLDGQNARFVACEYRYVYTSTEGDSVLHSTQLEMHAGSRTEWRKEEGNSNWWKVQKQVPWIRQWCEQHPGNLLYGETYGWVAPLRYGAQQGKLMFRAFDILDGMNWLDAKPFMAMFPEEQRVPCLGIMPFDFEKLKALADGTSLIPGANHMREGIVIRPVEERSHYKLGRVLLKLVSNAYLEKSSR
jgi:RNA ligase (TIGR02306 family)